MAILNNKNIMLVGLKGDRGEQGVQGIQGERGEGIDDLFELSANLFNVDSLIDGIVISSTGAETSNAGYATSDFILLDAGTYSVTKTSTTGPAFISYYTTDKVFSRRVECTTLITIDEKCYVRLSGVPVRMRANVMLVKGDSLPSEFIPYSKKIKRAFIPNVQGEKIDNESLRMGKTNFIKTDSTNLINHRTMRNNSILRAGHSGNTYEELLFSGSDYGTYALTDRIYLKPATAYTCKDVLRAHVFDIDTNLLLESHSFSNYNSENTFTTPNREAYVHLSVYIAGNYSKAWQLNEGNAILPYEKHRLSVDGHKLINETVSVVNNPYHEIINWNKRVIDKAKAFTLSEDITSDEYALAKGAAPIIALYDELVALNPAYITKTEHTVTAKGGTRTICRYDFVEPNVDENGDKFFEQDNKIKIILSSGTHPEYSGIYGLYYALREITNNPDLIDLRRNIHFIVIPVLSPTALDNNTRYNANGIDIARGFEVSWVETSPTNADGTTNGTYGGAEPMTEPECVYLDSVFAENKDAIFYTSCHSSQRGISLNGVTKDNIFMWGCSATNYMVNINTKVVDKMSRVWRKKYGNTVFANGNNLVDSPYTQLGTAELSAPNGSESKQALKYGIQGSSFEVVDWCRFNDNRQSQGYMTPFVVSRAAEVYINLILTVCDCFDYADKKLM